MLRVTVEIVPYGVEKNAKVIERMLIANVGTEHNIADYEFVQTDSGNRWAGEIRNFPRDWGAWALIREALTDPINFSHYSETDGLLITQSHLDERLDTYDI